MSVSARPLRPDEVADDLRVRDLSDPAAGPHALQLVIAAITAALQAAWPVQVRRLPGPRIVEVLDNYDHLGYPPDAITRDARYTRYVDPGRVLRSHSSAMIPPALRAMATEADPPGDLLLAAAGICYRRDSVDWQHTSTPHQMDLWRMRRGCRCTSDDLDAMVALAIGAALPCARWRLIETVHPYTVDGRQIDVRHAGNWVEVGECGLASPDVLARAGLDARRWSGLAMGLGLDRLLMLRKGIPDIRLLRSSAPRIVEQMHDLAPYRPVSHQPAVRRDLSLVVSAGTDLSAEALGDRVRHALGAEAGIAESVAVRSIAEAADLPAHVVDRLGLRAGQRNVTLRVVLRSLERSLTDAEANELRDRIYAELHEGPLREWATR